MKIAVVEKEVSIHLDAFSGDDFYFAVHALSQDKKAMPSLYIQLCLDRVIELRDKLTQIINTEVAKINAQINNPTQVATELAEVIDGLSHKVG